MDAKKLDGEREEQVLSKHVSEKYSPKLGS